ncbi:hypothetical protein SYK_06550 [Pseudodesulfovibrio nedwellii]|uniref:Uncharacterized protein n=1 Tax=Pseudodesulfovibrio nedwellii TaxID=2973072 RepID=A0ABN6S3M4_9BACT|nr:hypothetical protein [Pseudodesulfovibrio nedwellii]BDQ36295.1 hypothetical protein SYK_06550 [Pseudodesulfovibrio nedwellii]
MPDKWGRPTAEDGLKMASSAVGLMSGMKRNQLYDEQIGEIGREKENREQVGLGLKALQSGGERPDGMTEQNWIAAQGQYATGLGHQDTIAKANENKAIRTAANNYIPVLQQNNYDFSAIKPTNSAEVAAYAGLVDTYSQTEQGKATLMENRKKILASKYTDFLTGKQRVNSLLAEGKTDEAIKGIELLSSKAPLPYSLGDYDSKTKTFGVHYLDSNQGNTATGERMPMKDVWQMISGMDEKQFFMQGAQHAAAIQKGNLTYQCDPSKHMYAKGMKDGRTYTIVPQKNINDLSDLDYLVFSEDGGDPVTVRSMAELKKHFKIENLGREKDLTAIEGNKALIKQRESATELNEGKLGLAQAKAGREASDATLKRYRDALNDMTKGLKGVKDGEGNTFVFPTGDDMESMPEADRIPFVQKVVGISQDPALSNETRSMARRWLQYSKKLGYIDPDPTKEERAEIEKIKKLTKQLGPDGAQRVLNEENGGGPSRTDPDIVANHRVPAASQGLGLAPVKPKPQPVQVASNTPPQGGHPLAQYRGKSQMSKNGTIWAKGEDGQARRIMVKPSEKIRDGKGQLHDSPHYAEYLKILKYLGLTGNTQLAQQ